MVHGANRTRLAQTGGSNRDFHSQLRFSAGRSSSEQHCTQSATLGNVAGTRTGLTERSTLLHYIDLSNEGIPLARELGGSSRAQSWTKAPRWLQVRFPSYWARRAKTLGFGRLGPKVAYLGILTSWGFFH